jgi:hypothetical protein
VEQARLPAIMWVSKPITNPDRRACCFISLLLPTGWPHPPLPSGGTQLTTIEHRPTMRRHDIS